MAKALIVEDSSTDAYRALKILEDFFADSKVTNSLKISWTWWRAFNLTSFSWMSFLTATQKTMGSS